MGYFVGFVQQEATIQIPFLTRSTTAPLDAAALPNYRVYGPSGLMQNGTGTVGFKDAGVVTGATNANPIVVTAAGHNLQTGNIVTIAGVLGNTNANGTWTVTRIDANTFSIAVAGNSAYVSGGTWHMTGLYTLSINAVGADGYVAGVCYTVIVDGSVNSANYSDAFSFCVV